MDRQRDHALDPDARSRRSRRVPRWAWFNAAAFVTGLLPVILALTLHNRGSAFDPDCIRSCYTFVHTAGPGILGYLGAPAVIALMLPILLHLKSTRRSHFADRAALVLAGLSCVLGFVGLLTAGLSVLPVTVLTVCAVATAPLAPGPPAWSSLVQPRRGGGRLL
jgi:hypothetical protein